MPTVVNICGPGRTGSTVLDLMLGNGEDTFSIGEAYALYWPWRHRHLKPVCSCGDPECAVWGDLLDVDQSDFYPLLFEKTGAKYIIDSSKYLPWVLENNIQAEKNGYSTINLLTWKHPVELSYSHWKRGRGDAFWKKRFVPYYTEFFDSKLPFVSVYAGGLVANPKGKIKEICENTGIQYFEGKEKFWETTHHYLNGSSNVLNQYKDKQPTKNLNSYSTEFEAIKENVYQDAQYDQRVCDIVASLEKNEVSKTQKDFEKTVPKEYPLWYYRESLLRYPRKMLAELNIR